MTDAKADTASGVRAITLCGVAATGVFASAALGALTNAINGWISPLYFINIMGWPNIEDVWRASIAQGILEGLLFGVLFSLVFTAGVGIITKGTSSYGFAARHMLGIVGSAFACWCIGGLAAMGLASLSPEFYREAFRGVPDDFGPMMAYAWVGGSIWGVQLGGLMAVVLGLVILRANWQKQPRHAEPGVGADSRYRPAVW